MSSNLLLVQNVSFSYYDVLKYVEWYSGEGENIGTGKRWQNYSN